MRSMLTGRYLKTTLLIVFLSTAAVSAFARGDEEEWDSLKICLKHWGKSPFTADKSEYRVLSAGVKVFGVGSEIVDDTKTEKPELVLVKPNVSVFSKGKYKLMNPNGWYCLKGKVAVFSKVAINVHCKASLASTKEGVTILGSNDQKDGVTIFGKSEVNRIGCQ